MGLGWNTTGRPTAPPPRAVGPFRGAAWAGRSAWPPGWPGLLQGQKWEGGYWWWWGEQWILGLTELGRSSRQRKGLRLKLGLRTCVVSGPWGEGNTDPVAKDILVFHSLAGTWGCLRAAEAKHRSALGHAKHLAAAVVRQTTEPELHSIPQVLVTVDWEVVHVKEVETGLREWEEETTSLSGLYDLDFRENTDQVVWSIAPGARAEVLNWWPVVQRAKIVINS